MAPLKSLLALIFITICGVSAAQTNPAAGFQAFAVKQDGLLSQAYKQHDTTAYLSLLNQFEKEYKTLAPQAQKDYTSMYVNTFYNMSCLYSLLNNKGAALNYLEKSIKAGYINYAHLQEDADLKNIRSEKRFKVITEPLRSVGDYLYILKKAAKYNLADNRQIPPFTYQSSRDPKLVALRKQFKLDSVGGFGNEQSRIINILHWVHNTVPHNGQVESGIKQINANEIISAATTRKVGVSCGELATTLNDCLLAMGWKSRKIYCFPKDSLRTDPDSHVINIVYVSALKKWIWVDPTNNAYVMNEQGDLLSIEEVREKLINNKPLIVNPDANWNRKNSIEKDFYLMNYMAKNLYMFYTPLNSEYDLETWGNNKTVTYVHLLPLDYFKQEKGRVDYYNKDIETNFVHYYTNNPAIFWQTPKD